MAGQEPNLGRLLRRHRNAASLTQEELAERAGISTRTVSDVERGLRSRLYLDTAERIASALGLAPADRTEFEAAARSHRRIGAEVARDFMGPRSSLPYQPTSLIDRVDEVIAITDALAGGEVRLLTLIGAGGIGKTRVAVAAASRLEGVFPRGVFFVPLATTHGAEALLFNLASSIGIRPDVALDLEAISNHLAGGRSLLVLDTFEHLLGAAVMVGELIARTPGMTVLATSREALHLRCEREFPLAPLSLPPENTVTDELALEAFPATALFLERARALKPDFALDAFSAAQIASLCTRLDGLPLAIELAAARLRHMPLAALGEELQHLLAVLSGGPRDLPPRQQTMRGTVAWSYDLLLPMEQEAFRALSVFAGGWTLAAARSIIASKHLVDVLAVITALVDKSVALLDGRGPEPRYRMLDVIREFAMDECANRGETKALRQRHAAYFLALAEEAEPALGSGEQAKWYRRLEEAHDDLRAALRWSIENENSLVALRLAGALWQFWRAAGYYTEGRGWLRDALWLAPQAGDEMARAKALWGAAWLACHQGDYDAGEKLAEELLPLAQQTGDRLELRNALAVVGLVAMARGRYQDALEAFRQGLEICRPLGPSWHLATSYLNLGMATTHSGDPAGAEQFLGQALELYRELGDRHFLARSQLYLGYSALAQDDPERARALFQRSLVDFQGLGDKGGIAEGLEALSAIRAAQQDARGAAIIAGAAEALREAIIAEPFAFDSALTSSHLERARSLVPAEEWRAAFIQGYDLPG